MHRLGWLGWSVVAIVFVAGCVAKRDDVSADPTVAARCTLTPATGLGPHFVASSPLRSDLRGDDDGARSGVPLRLNLTILDRSAGCTPVAGAAVHAWHPDALGEYSGVAPHEDRSFLRGQQRTDAAGHASFDSIVPGWVPGRAIQLHVKVEALGSTYAGQLFFPDEVLGPVFAQAPYEARGPPDTRLPEDEEYLLVGTGALLPVVPQPTGYVAMKTLIIA